MSRIDLASVVVCCEDFQTVSLHNVGRASVADSDDTPNVELRPPSAITTAVQAAVSRSIVGRAASALKSMGMLRTRLPRVVAVPSRFHRGRSACVACVFVRAPLARGHPHDIRPASSVLAAATAAASPGKPGSKPKRVKVFASPMSLSWIADPATKHGNAEVIIGATGQLQVRQASHCGCVVATGSSCCQEQAKSKKRRNRKRPRDNDLPSAEQLRGAASCDVSASLLCKARLFAAFVGVLRLAHADGVTPSQRALAPASSDNPRAVCVNAACPLALTACWCVEPRTYLGWKRANDTYRQLRAGWLLTPTFQKWLVADEAADDQVVLTPFVVQ